MRWKSIIFPAVLIAAASAHFLNTDNLIVVEPVAVTMDPNDETSMPNDEGHSSDTGKDSSDNGDAGNEESSEINNSLPDSNSRPITSRQTREASENESNEGSNLSDILFSKEETTPGFETVEPVKPDSEESEENVNSTDTSQSSPSGEFFSAENGCKEILPVSASLEEEGVQSVLDSEENLVQTTQGPVRGFQWPDNTEIVAFYDIPYGKLNGLFDPPASAQSWDNVHEVAEHSKICPQLHNGDYIGVTNCLTLSIFIPKNAENASVLFHIYDGHTNTKSADPLVYGPDYLVPKGVILVLPNYRLGVFGFLCMQNETAPGNAGLKDLSLALEWVIKNIPFFGGNAANIVVSGKGTAGAYADYLAICSKNKNYIKKVITESGSALSHWALDRDPKGTANKLINKLNEEHAVDAVYDSTLNETAIETILRAAEGIKFMPCIEYDNESIIEATPWKILQSKKIDATFMIGSANLAGTHEAVDTTSDSVAQINEHFELLLPEDLAFKTEVERIKFAQQLRAQYFANESITVDDIDELSLWYTDASYLSPELRLARPLVAGGATVYLYEFAFVGNLNWELEALNKPVQGAVRGDLVGYLFRKNGITTEEDSSEKRMIELMVDLWASFIKTGKPVAADVEWNELKEADDEQEEWLLISSEPELKKGVHVERLRLWTTLYNQHFIDNSAIHDSPQPFLTLAVSLICLMTTTN